MRLVAPFIIGDMLDMTRPLAYSTRMKFEWDDAKSTSCLARRGFDFAYAVRVFLDPHRIVFQDRRRDYGEERYQMLGLVDGRAYVVVYTMRGFRIPHHIGPKSQQKGGRKL